MKEKSFTGNFIPFKKFYLYLQIIWCLLVCVNPFVPLNLCAYSYWQLREHSVFLTEQICNCMVRYQRFLVNCLSSLRFVSFQETKWIVFTGSLIFTKHSHQSDFCTALRMCTFLGVFLVYWIHKMEVRYEILAGMGGFVHLSQKEDFLDRFGRKQKLFT